MFGGNGSPALQYLNLVEMLKLSLVEMFMVIGKTEVKMLVLLSLPLHYITLVLAVTPTIFTSLNS